MRRAARPWRSLVYLVLSAVAILIYAGCVALVSGTVGGIVAVAVIVVALHPLHRRVQAAVNRLLYGERDDPAATLRQLGDRLEVAAGAEDALNGAAETLPAPCGCRMWPFAYRRANAALTGSPARTSSRSSCGYRGASVGELVVAPRDPGGRLSSADTRSLEAISRQLGVAAHAVQLSRELQLSRERIVIAREEERRRLRREFHDRLGPTLAALALELDTARELVDTAPQRVEETLQRAAARATDTVADVRRIVYNLRPPTLDDLGLIAAIREQADRLSASGIGLTVEAPDQLPQLPAAVEVAAYRLVSEALANVVRHSAARACMVGLHVDHGALMVLVRDDGRGIDPGAPLRNRPRLDARAR
jgi:signal transduction histidine kinase